MISIDLNFNGFDVCSLNDHELALSKFHTRLLWFGNPLYLDAQMEYLKYVDEILLVRPNQVSAFLKCGIYILSFTTKDNVLKNSGSTTPIKGTKI
jgi:hypothetical protein